MLAAPCVASDALVVIFNSSPNDWYSLENPTLSSTHKSQPSLALSFEPAWKAVVELLSILATGWNRSKVSLVGVHSAGSKILWESSGGEALPSLHALTDTLATFIGTDYGCPGEAMLSLGLAQALCIINAKRQQVTRRFSLQHQQSQQCSEMNLLGQIPTDTSRIIVLDVGVCDYVYQYSSLLNLALAAHKQSIVVDVCSFGTHASAVVQQLAEITSGLYLNFTFCIHDQMKEDRAKGVPLPFKDSEKNAETEHLMIGRMLTDFLVFHYTTRPACRDALPVAQSQTTDCSSVCKCHQRVVEIGLVCSCCLAIYCKDYKDPICSVCRVRFKRDRIMTVANVKLLSHNRRVHNDINNPSPIPDPS